jgi:hypothetical protein
MRLDGTLRRARFRQGLGWISVEDTTLGITSEPAVVFADGKVHVVVRGAAADGFPLLHLSVAPDAAVSTAVETTFAGPLPSSPGLAASAPGTLDVFVRSSTSRLVHGTIVAGTFSGFVNDLGGVWTSRPNATSWGEGRLDVVGRGARGQLLHWIRSK